MKKFIQVSIITASLLLSACGGGGSSPTASTIAAATNPAAMVQYGSDYPAECQTSTIIANSNNPAGLADVSSGDWSGNTYDPLSQDKYIGYCRSKISGIITKADFDAKKYFITITSKAYYDEGTTIFEPMPCPVYGREVHVITYVLGLAAPLKGFTDVANGLYDASFGYTDSNGNYVMTTAEAGNGQVFEYGGIMLASDSPVPGQVVTSSITGMNSCTDPTPNNLANDTWTSSTVDTTDHFGTAVNPVSTTCLYEQRWSGVTCYEYSQYVGLIHGWTIEITQNSDGDYVGTGFDYNAIRTDRQLDASPTGVSALWNANN